MARFRFLIWGLLVGLMLVLGVGATSAQSETQWHTLCSGAPANRLTPGQQGRVTPGLPNVLRAQPRRGWDSTVLGYIPGGGVFTVLNGYGPQCGDGMWWYYVSYNGTAGWTPEGQFGVYWTEPYYNQPQPSPCQMATRLTPGGSARVTPGLPNVLRTQPRRGWDSQIVGYIPGGATFTVLNGYAAQCGDGMWWFYVSYNGTAGWTPEGQNGVYWTENYSQPSGCNSLPPRLQLGLWGIVTPGLPNTLRSQPTSSSARLGQIPAGGIFQVLQGPVCGGGINWWYVNYNGVAGWTGEGQWGTYWLAPTGV